MSMLKLINNIIRLGGNVNKKFQTQPAFQIFTIIRSYSTELPNSTQNNNEMKDKTDPFEVLITTLQTKRSPKQVKSKIFVGEFQDFQSRKIALIIRDFVDTDKLDKVLTLVRNKIQKNKFIPSKDSFQYIAAKLAKLGQSGHLSELRKLHKEAHLTELEINDIINQNLNDGNIAEAYQMLETLIKSTENEYLEKIGNVSDRVFQHVVDHNLNDYVEKINILVKSSLQKNSNYLIASIWWKICFMQCSYSYQHTAEVMIEENANLIKYLPRQFPHIIHTSLKKDDKDALLRLVQVVLKNKMNDVTPVLSIYLEYFCDACDYENAMEVYWFAVDNNLHLTARSVNKFLVLNATQKRDASSEIIKTKLTVTKPCKQLPYKF